jgi:hypothetical protein
MHLPLTQRSSKLTALRKGPSDASVGRTLGHTPSGWRLRFVLVVSSHSKDVGDFSRVARAHRPAKSLRSTMQPSTYAVCQAAKWLKSSALRLSEKGAGGSQVRVPMAKNGQKDVSWSSIRCP